MKHLKSIALSLLALAAISAVSCIVDPKVPISAPWIYSLSLSEISYHSLSVSAVVSNVDCNWVDCELVLRSDSIQRIPVVPDEKGKIEFIIDGLPSDKSFDLWMEITDGRKVISSEAKAFHTLPEVVTFESEEFRAYCIDSFDIDGDGELSFREASDIEELLLPDYSNITSLKGIEHFPSLRLLMCNHSDLHGVVDLRQNTNLCQLGITYNHIEEILLTPGEKLEILSISGNPIRSFDLSLFPNMKWFDATRTQITELDTSRNPYLMALYIADTHIKSLNLENQSALINLLVRNTDIVTLDVSTCAMYGTPLSLICNMQESGNGKMLYLFIREGQFIPYITENRDENFISTWTKIVVR